MKKQYLLTIWLLCSVVFLSSQCGYAEVIRSFESVVKLQKDAVLDVSETIVYDFQGAERHGIFRFIPIKYDRYNNTYSLHLKVLSIADENGKAIPYKESNEGRNINIRIGDPDITVTGVHTYKLHYEVLRAVNFFSGAPEVYWNATGDQWPVDIQKVTAQFYPPSGTNVDQLKIASFYGPPGATTPASKQENTDHVTFGINNLSSSEGLTFVVGLPAGAISQPSIAQTFWWFFADWWPAFAIPLIALATLVSAYLRGGRDIDGGQAVAVEWYPPKDLSPAEVGTLVDERCDMQDILSTLFDLAARGYLQIHEHETKKFLFMSSKDYSFVRMAPDPVGDVLAPHEKEFLNGIFSNVNLSKQSDALSTILQEIATHQQTQTYQQQNPPAAPTSQNTGTKFPDISDPVGLLTAGTVSTKRSNEPQTTTSPTTSQEPQPTSQIVQLSDLKERFYTHIPTITSNIYEALTLKKLFTHNPESVRSGYQGMAFVIGTIGIFLFFFTTSAWGIGAVVAAIMTYLSSSAMPSKTAKGSHKLRECLGFARFVKLVEKPRLEMMQQEDPQIFGRLLPYAIALGVADQWAEGFEGLLHQPPDWYFPAGYGAGYIFSTHSFMHSMGNGMNTMTSTFQSAPKSQAGSGGSGFSSGGGFSGGGFGGGGGGSW